MKHILFLDTVCPKPYNDLTLQAEAMGGTEATVVRVAESLGASCKVFVCQKGRTEQHQSKNVLYAPLDYWKEAGKKWDSVIILRTAAMLPEVKATFPDSKLFLWLHDLASKGLAAELPLIEGTGTQLICVSSFHVTDVVETLRAAGATRLRTSVIYNPVDDNLKPDGTSVDLNQLVFFSSPHKGLDYVLELFGYARSLDPALRLCIANPGYVGSRDVRSFEGVHSIGAVPHQTVLNHVRSALCVFYPNVVFPETFGLVFAESNAVGTPVLAHRFGAAAEVLDHPSQVMDCRDIKGVVDRLLAWKSGARPTVRCSPQFRMSAVTRRWKDVLGV